MPDCDKLRDGAWNPRYRFESFRDDPDAGEFRLDP
jgi:hypothetical protein